MGKLFGGIVLALLAVAGLRVWSSYQLQERLAAYQQGLRVRALAALPGADSVPSEDLIRERAEALGRELDLDVTEIEAKVSRGVAPGGLGGIVAGQLGSLPGTAQVNAQGETMPAATLHLRTNQVAVRAHVHAEGFLCSLDEWVAAAADIGYALE